MSVDDEVAGTDADVSFDAVSQGLVDELEMPPEQLRARYRAERDRRLRPDGVGQYEEATGDLARFVEDPYAPADGTRAPLTDATEVIVVGGGFAGLLAAARLCEAGVTDVRIIERGSDLGGTWYWNRYPGVQCDIDSYVYMPLLEELGYIPRFKYAPGNEIRDYARSVGEHYGLYSKACLQTQVTRLEWEPSRSQWLVQTDRGDHLRARFVVLAVGPLSRPKLPGTPGLTSFEGHSFHTSRWDYAYTGGSETGALTELADKRVGLIGTGATAVQCVPHLGRASQQLYVFQRTPPSVDVRGNRPTDPAWSQALTPGWQRDRVYNFTAMMSGADLDVDEVSDAWSDPARWATDLRARIARPLSDAEEEQLAELLDFKKMQDVRKRVDSIVRDPATADSLKPWYRRMCKRPCFHDDYLATFNLPNVALVDTKGAGVERVTRTGVVANGEHFEIDCLIFSTGFDYGTSFSDLVGCEVIGRDGARLSDKWADGPVTLHGAQSNGFPNCFFVGRTLISQAVNYLHSAGEMAVHIAYIIAQVRAAGAKEVEASAPAEQAWREGMLSRASRAQKFHAECTPSYFNAEGDTGNPNTLAAAAYNPIDFFQLLSNWRSAGTLEGTHIR